MDSPRESSSSQQTADPPRESRASNGSAVRRSERVRKFAADEFRAFAKRRGPLIMAVICGILAVYVHASSWMSEILFGKDWETSWVWWGVAVPLDVLLAIYFTRFLGAMLARTWLLEIANSPVTRQAILTLGSSLVSDPQMGHIVASLLDHKLIVEAISMMTAGVVQDKEVCKAVSGMTAEILVNAEMQDAVVATSSLVTKDEAMRQGIGTLLDGPELTKPLGRQIAGVLSDDRVANAISGMVQEVLSDQAMKQVVHSRAISIVGNHEVFQAGGRGVLDAMFAGRCCSTDSEAPESPRETITCHRRSAAGNLRPGSLAG